MNKKNIKMLLILLIVLVSSCSKFLEDYSQDLSKVEGWKDLDELLLGDGYMKPSMITYRNSSISFNNPNLVFLHFMTDELEQNRDDDYGDTFYYLRKYGGFGYYTWQQDTGLDKDGRYIGGTDAPWDLLYAHINAANIVLGQIDKQPAATDDDHLAKERIKGEAYFLRGAYYFLLANLYARPYDPNTAGEIKGIPLKTSDFIEDKAFERPSLKEVYTQILADLDQAESLLQNKKKGSIYRANIEATYLLKSRVYLYMQEYNSAAIYAQKVLDLNSHLTNLATVSPGSDVFTKDSKETVFSMGGYLLATFVYSHATREPGYIISRDLDELYHTDDYRLGTYVQRLPGGQTVFTKIGGKSNVWNKPFEISDSFHLRVSEAYLTLAEASVFLQDETRAKSVLAGFLATRMKSTVALSESGNDLIDFIREERAREFCLEGHRWFDLRRYTVSNAYKWSKEIEHSFTEFDYGNPIRTVIYKLNAYDPAYTLDIPRAVINFQPSLGESFRPHRPINSVINY
ncbi:RagB/SusD family nutrient uptake outer membrane protein [Sphingobacterium paucimobilis]|uniref:RagB/SusD family nutrient uptake outer membrane protein n=1 Tax=Sphingobacterium paucimobilis HER1398 TaxID=1346330 RepID=U2J8Q3_9SPHI|nr:RagB/SusD family nutrient uptake outer membrane protein [Sphingobacterium paucimobilis]ERJ59028.1 hypothetical protein M472_09620 [Sphingobacterium paucimobilis HER1398]